MIRQKEVITATVIATLMEAFFLHLFSLCSFRWIIFTSGSLYLAAIILDFIPQFAKALGMPYFLQVGFMTVIYVVLILFIFTLGTSLVEWA